MDYETLMPLLRKLAIEAGAKIMEIYNSDDFEVKQKSDESPVTEADEAADDEAEEAPESDDEPAEEETSEEPEPADEESSEDESEDEEEKS